MAIVRLYQVLLLILAFNSSVLRANEPISQLVLGKLSQQQQVLAILKQAYQNIGISIVSELYPSKRSLIMSNKGIIDGELLRIDNLSSQYPNLIKVPVPLHRAEHAAFTIDGQIKFKNINEIPLNAIAITRGIVWQENFIASHPSHVIQTQTIEQQLRLLKLKRVKYIIASVQRLRQVKGININFSEIKQVSPVIAHVPYFHYLHKKHRHLIPQLTVELKKIIAETNVPPLTVPIVCCETH